METNSKSRFLSRRSFLSKAATAVAALAVGGVMGNKVFAQDAVTTEALTWQGSMEMVVDFSIIAPSSGRYKRPYVAVWVEDSLGQPIRTLALWVNSRGSRWIPDLRRWYRDEQSRKQMYGGDLVRTVSSPTRLPGKYSLVWDGLNDANYQVGYGDYYICVESAREHGPYHLIREKITLGSEPMQASFAGDTELGAVSIDYRALNL